MKGKRVVATVIAALLLILAGCSAVPDQLQATIKDLPNQIENSRKAVDDAEKAYGEQIKDPKYDFTRSYTPEQMRTTRFATARTNLDEAKAVFEGQVKPLEKDFKIEQLTTLETQVNRVRDLIKTAETNAKEPLHWAGVVIYVRDNTSQALRDTEDSVMHLNSAYESLKAEADKAKTDFPHQLAKINEKLVPFKALATEANAALNSAKTEAKNASPNFAVVAEGCDKATNNTGAFDEGSSALSDALKGLYVRETHTLIDIRVDSMLSLGRTSWNEAVDGGEVDFEFPGIPVEPEVADYFAQVPADTTLATYNSSWGGDFTLKLNNVDQARWDALKLDPGQAWPQSGGHNSSEIWMDELEDTYCHKLKVFKNGKPDASGRPTSDLDDACVKYNTQAEINNGIYWEESDELLSEAIGMDIYSKSYGDFPEQASEAATPPGIGYVNDPTTGEWRTDSTGHSFWYFYGQYRFFNDIIAGPYPYYYRSQYDTWSRNYRYSGKPYYMPDANGTPRFGGKSPQAQSRFPNSNYTKQRLGDATVRNSGPVSRSGGPGGGGK